MFKFSIAAAIGLSAAISAVHADTIVVQTGPGPFDPVPFHSDITAESILHAPGFERLTHMCTRLGFECAAPATLADADDVTHPIWSDRAQADAEKRRALLEQELEDYAENYAEHWAEQYDAHPELDHVAPPTLFGWGAPIGRPNIRPLPNVIPHAIPHVLPHGFAERFSNVPQWSHPFAARPDWTLPRTTVPYVDGFSRLEHLLNTPRHGLPRHGFPRGRGFSWPSL